MQCSVIRFWPLCFIFNKAELNFNRKVCKKTFSSHAIYQLIHSATIFIRSHPCLPFHLFIELTSNIFLHICVLHPVTTTPATSQYPEIATLLTLFSILFQTPTSLPSSRPTNHAIHLLPNSKPINVHPYHYPYFQKQEIEAQVKAMI